MTFHKTFSFETFITSFIASIDLSVLFLYKIVDKMGMLKVENIIALMLTLTVHILPLQLLE